MLRYDTDAHTFENLLNIHQTDYGYPDHTMYNASPEGESHTKAT